MKLNIGITDNNLEKDGAWIEWDRVPGVSVKMKRSGLLENQERLLRVTKQHHKALRGSKKVRAGMAVQIQFLSEYIVVDWKGITEDGVELSCTKEHVNDALTKYQDFYVWVLSEADNIDNFEPKDEDDSTVQERGEELKK